MKKLAAVSMSALMIVLLVGLVAAPASAQPYPPRPRPTCNVSDSSISPGDQVTITGKHWRPGSTVRFTLQPEGTNLGSTTVGVNGKFSAVVTIPTNIVPGPHTIECSGISRRGVPTVRAITIQILGSVVSGGGGTAVSGGGGTAFTGTILNVPVWMALIAALFVAGVAAVSIGRRRRRSVQTGP